MNSLIFPLADCPGWRHSAMFCFPQIESREVLAKKLHLSDAKLMVRVLDKELGDYEHFSFFYLDYSES